MIKLIPSLLVSFVLALLPITLLAQVTAGDCSDAVNICTNASFSVDPNGSGNVVEFTTSSTVSNPQSNPFSSNSGCLLSGELNSTWMIINIATTGLLEFSFGQNGGSYCYDWIMWPYNSNTCSSIMSNSLAPVRCNWNFPCESFTGIANTLPPGGEPGNFEPALNVTCGQQYIICFSNYSSAVTSVPLNFFGSATVSCTTFTPITVNSETICPGGTATLTANGGTTYSWNTGATTQSINVSPATTTSYTVTGTGPCGSGTATATVTVLSAADPACACVVTAGNNGPLCVGSTLNLTSTNVTGAISYSWSGPGGFTSSSQNPSISNVTAANAGTYTVTVNTGSSICTASTTVTINPLPTPSISGTNTICQGQSTTLTASGGGTYAWNTGATTAAINVSPAANTTYTVTVTSVAGCTASTSQLVTVNPLPTPSVGNNGPLCVGATLNLTSGGGTSYSWAGPGGYTSALQNPSITNVTTANGGTYTVTVTNANGCTASTTTNVVINPLPTPSVGNNGPLCVGATLNLTSGGGTGYSWSGPGGYTSALQNPSITNVTTAQGGVYTVTVTDANGCTASTTTNVVINPLPTPTAGNNGPLCPTNTLNLTSSGGGTYSWTGPSAFSSALQNPSIPNITSANGGTYTVTVTSAAGCTASASTTVSINPDLVVSANNNSPFCAGNTLNLSTAGGVSYSWSGPGGFTSVSQNPSIPNATPANNGTYTVTVTNASGCSGTATTNVTINPLPTPTANNDGPHCTGLTLNLSSTGGTGYSWSGPGGYTSATQNPSITNVTTANSGTYTVTVTDANGCTGTATTNVTINPLPTPTANNSGPHCTGLTLNLSATGGTGYSWSGPGGYTSTTQNPSITNVTTANSGTYTVTVTDANSCTATASTNVTIYALPTPTANNNTPVCEGVTVSITSTPAGMASYNWTGPGGYTSSTQNPSITNPTTAESGTYTVTVTDGNGCTATASTVVTVNAMPIPTAGNNGPVCSGVDINLTSSGGASYSWSGPGGYISVAQNPVLSPTTPSMSGTYTVTVSSGAGCSATATTSVTVNALPVPVAANDGPHCEGLVLTLNSMGGVSYNWTGPGGYTSTDQSPVINPTAASQTGTYTVTVTDVNGCTATTSTDVTIYALPVPSATSSGPACQGLSINLASGGGVSYSWVGPNAFSSAMQNPVLNNVDISHAGTYTVTVTSSDGCTASTTVDVVVNPLPQPNYSAANIIGCSPVCADFSDLSVIATGAVTGWEWSANGNVFSNAQNPTQCFSTPGTYDILLTATSDQGCTSSFIINDLVTVYVNPIADFTIYPEVIISNNPTANFTNTSTANAILWNWNFGDGTFGTDENPIHLYADTGQFCITLTVQTAQGCQDTTTHCLYIFPEYKIYIPNTFTPNDDKINDFFTVGGMGIESIEMQIFNRWGESVYTTTSMLGWPGTIGSTEVIAKQDVYVYKIWVITFQGEVFEYYGHVNLLR